MEEKKPLLAKDKNKKEDDKADKDKKEDEKKDESSESGSSSSESSYASSSNMSILSKDSEGNPKEWDEDKYIWRRKELDLVNKSREKKDMIPVVYRR
jgi:hypothetical protein